MIRNLLNVGYFAAGLLIALTLRELAKAFVAVRLGDHTPKSMGRLTLNPLAHADPFGTYILPAILLLPVLFMRIPFPLADPLFPLFAYAKPMPLNPWNLRKRDQHGTLIAITGPATNVALAFVLGALLRLTPGSDALAQPRVFLLACLQVTVIMAAMNLVPLPPFDAAKIVARFLPPRAKEIYLSWEQFAPLIVLVVFFILPGPIFAFVHVIGNGICQLVAGGTCLQ